MIVYADILIVVNTIVDYFLIKITEILLKKKINVINLMLASLFGGISSLYIFLQNSIVIFDFLYKFFVCFVMCSIAFGIKNSKKFLHSQILFFTVSCGYTGIILALWFIFKPNGLLINNSVVYFDVSPMLIIGFTVVFYIVFTLFNYIFKRTAQLAERCLLEIFAFSKKIKITALIDSGNSIEDIMSNNEIIIIDKSHIDYLFKEKIIKGQIDNRFRKIPCSTIGGTALLDGYRCDKAIVKTKDNTIELKNAILATSNIEFKDDYTAIINPRIFT